MTAKPEPNPQAVVATLTEFALDMHEDCCGCVRKEATHAARFVVWLAKCEAQTRREALEEAAQRVDDFYNTYFSESPGQKVIDRIKDAIRSIISPMPVGPKVKTEPPLNCNASKAEILENHEKRIAFLEKIACGGPVLYNEKLVLPLPEPPPAPSEAEELLLGHEFVEGLSTCQSGLDPKHQCHVVVSPQVECGQLESAHRGKRGVE